LAQDVDSQYALDVLHGTANDGGGLLWQTVAGDVLYADAEHRRSARVVHTFDACDVGVDLGWQQSLEGLVNNLYLRYGAGVPQEEVHVQDAVSISERGRFGLSLTTAISTEADAQRRAEEIVGRQSQPSWVLGGLEVELAFLPEPTRVTLLTAVDVHSLIAVTGLPPESPAVDALLWVEGWRETIGGDSWLIAYATSDYCRSAATAVWDGVPQSATWDSVPSDVLWDSAICFPPSLDEGRWDQTAATDRWDTLSPDIVWDSWV